MPDQLPLVEPAHGLIISPLADRQFFELWRWQTYFAAVGLLGLILCWATPVHDLADRFVATGLLLLLLAAWWLGFGRRLYQQGGRDVLGIGYFVGAFALMVPLLVLAPNVCWVLFALTPQTYMLVGDDRWANLLASGLVLLPAIVELVRSGVTTDFWTSVAIGVGAAGVSMLINLATQQIAAQSEERARLIEQLEAGRAAIGELSRQAGVAAERERLAAEIHDTLAQGFTSILTLMQAAASEPDRNRVDGYLDLAARTARENLGEARALVDSLTPPAMRAGSLVDAVLLRSAQEALANVRRHSGARTARISIGGTVDTVLLTVADDGTGFDPGAGTDGFGLRGMRNRVEQIGGTLTVDSGPCGTTVRVEVGR